MHTSAAGTGTQVALCPVRVTRLSSHVMPLSGLGPRNLTEQQTGPDPAFGPGAGTGEPLWPAPRRLFFF
jgi:hypothetical protein